VIGIGEAKNANGILKKLVGKPSLGTPIIM
jgi:hypothetical protein